MSPTNEQIRAEARRRTNDAWGAALEDAIIEVVREGWTPPEPVDPDLIAVLEFLSKRHPGSNYYHSKSAKSDFLTQICLAAYKAGREQERERAGPLVKYVWEDVGASGSDGAKARSNRAFDIITKYEKADQ